METQQTIVKRIKSIEGTLQITRSMRLVSIAKMQKAREAMRRNQPLLDGSRRLATLAIGSLDGRRHPLTDIRPVQCTLMVVLSGDRGLCGGYNAGVVRHALAALDSFGRPAKVITVGSKAGDALKRRRAYRPFRAYTGLSDAPAFSDAEEIAALIRSVYDSGEADEALLCYTRFTSMLIQNPAIVRLLPLGAGGQDGAATAYEPKGEELLQGVADFYLASSLYGAMLEASVCEQSARILSMDGAVRTAGEMIQELGLSYNQARQGMITQEITEIVTAADAVEGGL